MTTIDTVVSSKDGWVTIPIDTNSSMVVYNSTNNKVLFKIDANSNSKGVNLVKDSPVTVDSDIEVMVPERFNGNEIKTIITKIVTP